MTTSLSRQQLYLPTAAGNPTASSLFVITAGIRSANLSYDQAKQLLSTAFEAVEGGFLQDIKDLAL